MLFRPRFGSWLALAAILSSLLPSWAIACVCAPALPERMVCEKPCCPDCQSVALPNFDGVQPAVLGRAANFETPTILVSPAPVAEDIWTTPNLETLEGAAEIENPPPQQRFGLAFSCRAPPV